MELAAPGEWNLSSAWKTSPAARPRGCCCSGTLEQEQEPAPHPRAGAPSCGGAAAPAARGSPADHVPPPPKKQETQKVSEPGCLRKVEARSWCLGARAWREQGLGWRPPHKVQAQMDPPRTPRCPPPGLEASGPRGRRTRPRTPTLRRRADGKPVPHYHRALGAPGFALFIS